MDTLTRQTVAWLIREMDLSTELRDKLPALADRFDGERIGYRRVLAYIGGQHGYGRPDDLIYTVRHDPAAFDPLDAALALPEPDPELVSRARWGDR